MTQWDMTIVESLGLLKMDFLGLRTLTVIDDAIKILKHQGVDIDWEEIGLRDGETYRLFCEGRTNGVFQFESSGMKDLLRRAQPSKFEDLAAFNALYRPGALSVGMVDEYILRKLGKKKIAYILPQTKDILEETYGIIVYQEQVMLIAVEVAGFTMAEADMLRKAMGKKKIEVMAEQKEKFLGGAEKRNVNRAKAEDLWNYIEPFAGYGFNKSHSVAYALLAYRTAYLKAHYPVAFMAAMLNSEMGSSENVAKYVQECREMGIEVLPPSVNQSDWMFTVDGENVRFGLGAVKGIGEGAVEAILEARRRVNRFSSLCDFATEADLKALNHKVFECLIKAGCFDMLEGNRAALMAVLDRTLDFAQARQKEREVGQGLLFGDAETAGPDPDPSTRPWPDRERLRYEKETLGFYLTGHPLSDYSEAIARLTRHDVASLKEVVMDGGKVEGSVKVAGLVTRVKRVKIKSGRNEGRFMARFLLEDLKGSMPVAVFADQLSRFGHRLEEEAVVVVQGMVRERGSDVEMTAEDVVPISRDEDRLLAISLCLQENISRGRLLELKDVLVEHSGTVPVKFRLELPEHIVHIAASQLYSVRFGPELEHSIERLLGKGALSELRPEA